MVIRVVIGYARDFLNITCFKLVDRYYDSLNRYYTGYA